MEKIWHTNLAMTWQCSICPPLPNDYNLYQPPHWPYYCPIITDNAHCLHYWQTINYAFTTPLLPQLSTESMNTEHYPHHFDRTHDKYSPTSYHPTTSLRSSHSHDYTTVLSSIPWEACTAHLLLLPVLLQEPVPKYVYGTTNHPNLTLPSREHHLGLAQQCLLLYLNNSPIQAYTTARDPRANIMRTREIRKSSPLRREPPQQPS